MTQVAVQKLLYPVEAGELGVVNKRFPRGHPKRYGAIGDKVADDGVALQAAFDAVVHSHTQPGLGRAVRLEGGKYRTSVPLRLKDTCLRIVGDGPEESIIYYEGVAGGCIVSDAITYNKLSFENFGIIGDAASGKGIDLSATLSQSYLSLFSNLNIIAGQQAIHIPNLFSSKLDTVFASSFNNHAFQVLCGPSVSWINVYAGQCGAGKAGYRVTGSVRMYSCNGVNSGDYWGIFGNDPAAADGFQNDFVGTSYPDVVLEGCNVEAFNITGLYIQAPYIKFDIRGGAIVRALATPYHSLLRVLRGSNGAGNYIEVDRTRALISGGAATGSPFYSDNQDYLVVKGPMSLMPGITGMYNVPFGAVRPAINMLGTNDIFGDMALSLSAAKIRRLTAQVIRYDELIPAAGTAAVDVTGKTIVRTANVGATTINTFTFTQTIGNDFGRNGLLIVHVEDTFTTFKHNFASSGGMRLKGGVDYVAAKGDVLVFVWSVWYTVSPQRAGWVQIA